MLGEAAGLLGVSDTGCLERSRVQCATGSLGRSSSKSSSRLGILVDTN